MVAADGGDRGTRARLGERARVRGREQRGRGRRFRASRAAQRHQARAQGASTARSRRWPLGRVRWLPVGAGLKTTLPLVAGPGKWAARWAAGKLFPLSGFLFCFLFFYFCYYVLI